jgi:hypothetical protein
VIPQANDGLPHMDSYVSQKKQRAQTDDLRLCTIKPIEIKQLPW